MEWDKLNYHLEIVLNNCLSPLENLIQIQTQDIKYLFEQANQLYTLINIQENLDKFKASRLQPVTDNHYPFNSEKFKIFDKSLPSDAKKTTADIERKGRMAQKEINRLNKKNEEVIRREEEDDKLGTEIQKKKTEENNLKDENKQIKIERLAKENILRKSSKESRYFRKPKEDIKIQKDKQIKPKTEDVSILKKVQTKKNTSQFKASKNEERLSQVSFNQLDLKQKIKQVQKSWAFVTRYKDPRAIYLTNDEKYLFCCKY